ncbi:MAG: shufflon system plasmid conjugative transfer pilus tip adhesin PilV [Alphaproteobacteria bacterium]|nr:shufflon system plasmid conjugative transfer pilus tip adhesin PilV [Alphaproteobacteria bacterium]
MNTESRGNFLLQALLAIALVMAFMPFLAGRLSERRNDQIMTASSRHVARAARAAREFVRYNKDDLRYGVRVAGGDEFSDLLEPFGLPLGFIPQTAQGQKISLMTGKNANGVLALLVIKGSNLSAGARRELMARIGSDAAEAARNGILHGIGGWEKNLKDFGIRPDLDAIYVLIPIDDDFSELIRRNSKDIMRNRFHTDLDMGGYDVKNISQLSAKNAELDTASFGTLSITGSSNDRRFKNKIELLIANKAVFQTRDSAGALNISRGDLIAKSLSAYTLFRYGLIGSVEAESASLNSLAMAAGRTSFVGPYDWDIHGDAILSNVSIDTEQLEISGFINASRGQDVFIDSTELMYSTKSGIEARTVSAAYLTLRDQISSSLLAGGSGAIILDVRPAGVSVLPDVLSENIDNDSFEILKNPGNDDSETVGCRNIISGLPGAPYYNNNSVAQNLVCQYVFWSRLERRINIKQCRLDGRSNCG